MARRSGSTIQEELYSTPDEPAREELDDARLLDLDVEKESPFLRAQKRVSVRRGPLPKKTAAKLLWAILAIAIAAVGAIGAAALYQYGEHSWRFGLQSSDDIELAGLSNVTHAQVMEVMGGDIGRNVFFIPLEQRQKQLEQIPWVESASVMRFAPNRIKIRLHERTPVAFARVGSRIMLIDAGGVLMDLSTKTKYSFPVIVGMNSNEPLSTRAARMKTYNQLIRELDSGGARYSQDLSEVDLSDPEDVKVLTNDPNGEVLVYLGSSNFLDRFKIYVAHLREWRQQFTKVESVNLRYDRQIVVNPDQRGTVRQPALSAAAAKAAIAAGVKPAALIHVEVTKPSVSADVPSNSVKRPEKSMIMPPVSQRTRKDGAAMVSVKSAALKHPERVSHWHKRWTPAKHAAPKPAGQSVVPSTTRPSSQSAVPPTAKSQIASSPQRPTSAQKPSPVITEGQENH